MKHLSTFLLILIFSALAVGQTKPITAEEYAAAFDHAVAETNARFPFVHTFTLEKFENGLPTVKNIAKAERESLNTERQTFSTIRNGETLTSYQLRTGPGENVYCSTDGSNWTGPQLYECSRDMTIFGKRNASSVKYTLEETHLSGKKVKIYRRYKVFKTSGKPDEFEEEIALIDESGLFIRTTQTMGIIQPRSVTIKMVNEWKLNEKFEPITTPKHLAKPAESKPQMIRIS